MAKMKKGQLNQFLFTMVDKTNGLDIESGLAAADALIYYCGVNHGGSVAWASGLSALSKVPSLIHSGIFRATVKAAEAAYDQMLFHIESSGTVSCAAQNLLFELTDYDDSDLMSRLSDVRSDILSYLVGVNAVLSDFYSDFLSKVPKAPATASVLSDFYSDFLSKVPKAPATASVLSDFYSDFLSKVPKAPATASALTKNYSTATAAASRALINQSRLSDANVYLVYLSGLTSDFYSDFLSKVPKAPATASALTLLSGAQASTYSMVTGISDITSKVLTQATAGASRALLNQSAISTIGAWTGAGGTLSDIRSVLLDRVPKTVATSSQVSDMWSDLLSVFVADASDIASAVWAEHYATETGASTWGSRFAIMHSNVLAGASRALLNQSNLSYVSATLSDFYSDFLSKVPKAPATASAMTKNYSMLSDFYSDFGSKVPKLVANDSDLAALISKFVVMSDIVSDTNSMMRVASVTLASIASDATYLSATLSDFYSDFQSKVPKAVATESGLTAVESNLHSAIGGVSVTITASDISDIVSGIVAAGGATASQASQILLKVGAVSDVQASDYSLLTAFYSDFGSRVPKETASASALLDLSGVVSDFYSDFTSKVPKAPATASAMTKTYSMVTGISDTVSKTLPAATAAASRALLNQSMISAVGTSLAVVRSNASTMDAYFSATLSDFYSDFLSKVPKAPATASALLDLSGVVSDFYSDFQSKVPKAPLTASGFAVGATLTAAAIDAIWDETTTGHSTVGTFGGLFTGVRANTAAGGGSSTITLDASANGNDDFYNGCLVKIIAGTGAGQRRWITDYAGAGKVATVDTAWVTQPNATSKYVIL